MPNASILEELTLSSTAILVTPAVLDTVPSTLKKLELQLDNELVRMVHNKIGDYLYRVSQQCQLHEFALSFTKPHAFHNVLDVVYRFRMLQRLMLRFEGYWDLYQMERFLDRLGDACPSLSCLELNCSNAPTVHSITALKRLEHLNRFTFSVKDMEVYDSFWLALRTFPQLRCIQVVCSDNQDTKSHIRRLKKHRPDMDIMIGRRFVLDEYISIR